MDADVVVVGLGAVGAATLLALARRGVRAVGVDRFAPPHDRGSSHGESRVTRLAIGEGAAYVPMARRSHALWRELEAETGERLFDQVGMLLLGEGDGGASHGQAGFLGRTVAVAREAGVAHELLDAGEVRARFPQFAVRDAERGYFEPEAGLLHVERCVAAMLARAQALGAEVRTGEAVLGVAPDGAGVAVATERGRILAGRAVLAAGAWLPGLAGGVLGRVARVHRQVLLWLEPTEPALWAPERCPVFIWTHGTAEEDYLYGFPLLPGSAGVKAASERYDAPVLPDAVDRVVSAAEAEAIRVRHIAGRLRGVGPRITRTATCLYTVTPDAGFVLDRLWAGDDRAVLASACSGHGFKHSPALGERMAAMACGEMAAAEEFGLARFGVG